MSPSEPHSHHDHHGQAPPVEPGYPEHPEQPHAGHGAHGHHPAAHDAHAGHDAHGGHGAHDKHAGHSVAMFRDKFWITLALTVPTVIWGHMLMSLTGWHAPRFPGSQWIPPVFGTAVFRTAGSCSSAAPCRS